MEAIGSTSVPTNGIAWHVVDLNGSALLSWHPREGAAVESAISWLDSAQTRPAAPRPFTENI